MTPAPSLEIAPAASRASGLWLDTLTLSVIAGAAKLAGAVKSVAIARVFGSGPALDGFLLAFLLPSLLADTFCGALVPVTVPRLIELEHRSGHAAALALYRALFSRTLRYSLLGTAAIATGVGWFLALAHPALASANWHPIGLLALLMLPVIPCNAVANVWRAALNSRNNFAAPALTVMFTPALSTVAVLLAGKVGGIRILAACTTLGAAGELALLGAAMHRSGFPILPARGSGHSGRFGISGFRMSAFGKEYGYLAASGAVSGGTVAIGQAMAAWLGPGSVSALNYGTRLATVLMSIGPAALGVTVLPSFSRLAADSESAELRHPLRRVLLSAGAASAAAAGVFILFSAPIVRLTLQHGEFTATDTGTVASVQVWSLLQMPFMVGIAVFMRVFSVLQANRVLLPLSASALVLNLALNYVFMHRYGVAGISLASSVTQALLCAAMAFLVFGPCGIRLAKEVR